jgi:hypothetical protein
MDSANLWRRHQRHLSRIPSLGLALDISRMRFDDGFFARNTSLPIVGHVRCKSAISKRSSANTNN